MPLGIANILISGQTGVGKSTLISSVFRTPARSGGHRQTGDQAWYSAIRSTGVPVTIYDTPGIELGQSKKEVIREYRKTIKDSLNRPLDEHVHIAWYCMSAETPRIQDYDVEVIKALAEKFPCSSSSPNASTRSARGPGDRHSCRGLAHPRKTGADASAGAQGRWTHDSAQGLEELVERTHEILPEGVRRAFTNAQRVVIRLKVRHARAVVATAGAAAGTVGAAPIPVSDAFC